MIGAQLRSYFELKTKSSNFAKIYHGYYFPFSRWVLWCCWFTDPKTSHFLVDRGEILMIFVKLQVSKSTLDFWVLWFIQDDGFWIGSLIWSFWTGQFDLQRLFTKLVQHLTFLMIWVFWGWYFYEGFLMIFKIISRIFMERWLVILAFEDSITYCRFMNCMFFQEVWSIDWFHNFR